MVLLSLLRSKTSGGADVPEGQSLWYEQMANGMYEHTIDYIEGKIGLLGLW